MTMRHLLSAIVLLTVLATGHLARADDSSIITQVDDPRSRRNNTCWVIVALGEPEAKIFRCPGAKGWKVVVTATDAELHIRIGERTAVGPTVKQVIGETPIVADRTIEWRLRNGDPVVALQRYSLFERGAAARAMVLHKLNFDRTSCVAAIVAIDPSLDLAAELKRLVDTVVPRFRCGLDPVIRIGGHLNAAVDAPRTGQTTARAAQ